MVATCYTFLLTKSPKWYNGKRSTAQLDAKHWLFSHPFAVSGIGQFKVAAQLISHCLWLSDPGSE